MAAGRQHGHRGRPHQLEHPLAGHPTVEPDPAGAAAMGRAARARAEQAYSPDRHLAGLERLYERAATRMAA